MGMHSLWKAGWRDPRKKRGEKVCVRERERERERERGRDMPVLPLRPFFNAHWVAPQCRLCPSHCHRLREPLCQVRGFGDICHFSESPVASLAAWVEGRAGRRVCAPGEEQREVEEEGHVRCWFRESCWNDPWTVLSRTSMYILSMDL